MIRVLCLSFLHLSLTLAKEDDDLDLPLCPQNIEYFPQELPMHCRLPKNADRQSFRLPDLPDISGDKHQIKRTVTSPPEYDYFRSPSPDKLPPPISFPVPPFPVIPGFGLPPGIQIPGSQPGLPPPVPGMPGPMLGMPGPMPLPIPIPGAPAHKMPVIVMPFYSQDHRSSIKPRPSRQKLKRRPHRHHSFDVGVDSDELDDTFTNGSSEGGWWEGPKYRRRKKKGHRKYDISRRSNKHNFRRNSIKDDHSLLTPLLQYVTKDGYVIFEKKITRNEASDWLGPKDTIIANKEVKKSEIVRKENDEKNNYNNSQESREEGDPKNQIEDLDKDSVERSDREKKTGMKGPDIDFNGEPNKKKVSPKTGTTNKQRWRKNSYV